MAKQPRGPLSFSRVQRAPDATSPSRGQISSFQWMSSLGAVGVGRSWERGWHNPDWLGPTTPRWVPAWILKLMREDPQLSLGMGAVKSVFFGIDYKVAGGNKAARAFVQRTVCDAPWFGALLHSILNALDFGFQAHEILWRLEDVTFDEDGPGGTPPTTIEQANVVRGFVDFDPETLTQMNVDEQRALASLDFLDAINVPAEKILHAMHQFEWGNYFGCSLLRRGFNPFKWCNFLYLDHMRYMEGKANPPYIGTAPPRAPLDPTLALSGQVPVSAPELLAKEMMALRGGGFAALPYEPDAQGNNQWSVKVLEDTGRADQFITSIHHMQAMKLRAIFVPDRAMTQDTATGSFAMADAHIDMFMAILEGIKRATVLAALDVIVERVVRANFGRATSLPHFEASDLSRQKQRFVEQVVLKSLEVPLTLADKKYTPAMLVDFSKVLSGCNVPTFQPKDVAVYQLPARAIAVRETIDESAPAGPPSPAGS